LPLKKRNVTELEIRDLRMLGDQLANRLVPLFADEFTDKDGRRWFLEEFIEGETASELAARGALTDEIKARIAGTLLHITFMLNGMAPRDIGLENFVVRKDSKEVVMVDLGNRRFLVMGSRASPKYCVLLASALIAWLGSMKDPSANDGVFDAIANNPWFTENQGMGFLKMAAAEIRARGPDAMAGILSGNAAGLYPDLGDVTFKELAALTLTSLEGYIDRSERTSLSGIDLMTLPDAVDEKTILSESAQRFKELDEKTREQVVPSAPLNIDLPALIPDEVKNAFTVNGEQPLILSLDVDGDFGVNEEGLTKGGETITKGLEGVPDTRYVAVCYRHGTPERASYSIVIDTAARLRQAYYRILLDRAEVASYEFVLKFHVFPKNEFIQLDTLSLGRQGPNEASPLRGQGLSSKVFERFASALEGTYDGWGVFAVALEMTYKKPGEFLAIPYLMEKYFSAVQDLPSGIDDMTEGMALEDKFRIFTGRVGQRSVPVETATQEARVGLSGDEIQSLARELSQVAAAELTSRVLPGVPEHGGAKNSIKVRQFFEGKNIPIDSIDAENIFLEAKVRAVRARNAENAVKEAKLNVSSQVDAAKAVIGDFRQNRTDIVVMPGSEDFVSAQEGVSRDTARKLRKSYGQETLPFSYAYTKEKMDSGEWVEGLKTLLAERVRKAFDAAKAENKNPRVLMYLPITQLDRAKIFDKGGVLENVADIKDLITIVSEAEIPEDGVIDDVMHIVLAKALLNYERYQKGDFGKDSRMGREEMDRLYKFLQTLVRPGTIDFNAYAADPAALINKLLSSDIMLRIMKIDFSEIKDWKAAQDEVLRSL
jgi:hypothetical protein